MVTIIVINYRNEALTSHFVNDELSRLVGEFNVVVVNNGATPASDQVLSRDIKAPVIYEGRFVPSANNRYIISSTENIGFARGNNLAAKFDNQYLKSDYLLFSNNDIQLDDSQTIIKLSKILENHDEVALVGPKVIGLRGEFQSPEPYQEFWDRYVWMHLSKPFMNEDSRIRRFNLNYAKNAVEGYHYKVMGSFFMVRTVDFLKCGMMDPHTFLYAEETILTERLKTIGKKVYYYPNVTVVHAHGGTTSKELGYKGITQYQIESESYYYNNYMDVPQWQIWLGTTIYKIINFVKRLWS